MSDRAHFEAFLAAGEGRLSGHDSTVAFAALGQLAREGKPGIIRGLLSKMKPQDEQAAVITYLFVLTADSLLHPDKNGPILEAFAASKQPFATQAGSICQILQSGG